LVLRFLESPRAGVLSATADCGDGVDLVLFLLFLGLAEVALVDHGGVVAASTDHSSGSSTTHSAYCTYSSFIWLLCWLITGPIFEW